MRNYAENNRIAVYRKMRIDGLQVKKFTGGHPYLNNGLLMRTSETEPIYSYAKNYKKFTKEFSLFVWSTSSDQKAVEKQLDKVIKSLKREQIIEVINKIKSFAYVEQMEIK